MGFSHHPDYNYPESYFDIGVAKLNESVPSNVFGTIRPICLPIIPSENIGEYFSIYCKSSNIRRPHKIVAPDFIQCLNLYRGMDAWPISNLFSFSRPLDEGVSFTLQNFLPFLYSLHNISKDSLTNKTKIGKDSCTNFWGFTVFTRVLLNCCFFIYWIRYWF